MNEHELHLMRSYMENTQVTLYMAQLTKVIPSWGESMPNPPVCRLYYFRDGEGWIETRQQRFHPQPGQLYLLPAGLPVSFATNPERPFTKYWSHFTAEVGDVNLFRMLELPPFINVPDEAALERRFQELIAMYNSEALNAPLRVKAILLEIVSYYLEQSAEQNRPPRVTAIRETGKLNAVLAYIEANLERQQTVEELAELMHFHPNYFLPYFKSRMGVSPIAYINRKRVDKAKRLLTETDLPVSTVAEQVGLELYYFSRLFKKHTGQAPTEFRKYAAGTIGGEQG